MTDARAITDRLSTDDLSHAADELRRIGELAHPHMLLRLRDIGAFRPSRVLAGARVLPWLVGRGPSLGIVSQIHAAAQPDRRALVDRNGELTWRELDRRANRLARGLVALGVEPGDQVATLLRNGAEQVEVILAAQKLGVVVAPLNTWAQRKELETILERSVPAVLVYDTRHVDQIDDAVPRTVQLVAAGDGQDALSGSEQYASILAGDGRPLSPLPRQRGSAEIIIHTSGTTGVPKAAARDTGSSAIPAVASLLRVVPYQADDVMYLPAPLFHSFGLLSLSAAVIGGMTMVLPDRFDAEGSLADIEEHGCTAASFVPVMLRRIVDLSRAVRERYDPSTLRIVLASGSSISPALRRDVMERLGDVLYDLYGSTEAGWVAIAGPQDIRRHPESVGRPSPGVRVTILSPEGDPLPPGETGAIHARSGAQFEGYRSGETADASGGYLKLGDLGWLGEDGYLYVSGRADDMAVIGGENVYPIEVEQVIEAMNGVEDVAVVGVPDDDLGEVLVAFVVGDVDADAVTATCEDALASFKVPRRVEVVDELPRTSTGKVLRTDLRDRAST